MGYGLFSLLILFFIFNVSAEVSEGVNIFLNNDFGLDIVGYTLSLISFSFILTFILLTSNSITFFELLCITVSLIMSIVCFSTNNVLVFWVSYEMAIIPLLISLAANSPYSERFLAIWYLLSYVVVTSLPMLFGMLYCSVYSGSINISTVAEQIPFVVGLILFILFITKVPLPPFHGWLPVVHAEASTFVSVVLSGYVMKLGIIGLYRYCGLFIPSINIVMCYVFAFSILFLFAAFSELDTKRWLAFLSLSHIMIAIVGIYYSQLSFNSVSMVYCLGHGLSAGLLFYLFLVYYEISGSRNWLIVGFIDNVSNFWRVVVVTSMLTVASFPPSMAFLSEVIILLGATENWYTLMVYSIYLLVGALVPVILVSYMVTNATNKSQQSSVSSTHFIVVGGLFSLWLLGGLFLL